MAPAPRLIRELKTITAMVRIYCSAHHQSSKNNQLPCKSCREFLDYAEKRLTHCPFLEQKPTCAKCTVHCYKKNQKEHAKKIMSYAGPRMLTKHPIMAIRHLFDAMKTAPELPKKSDDHKSGQTNKSQAN